MQGHGLVGEVRNSFSGRCNGNGVGDGASEAAPVSTSLPPLCYQWLSTSNRREAGAQNLGVKARNDGLAAHLVLLLLSGKEEVAAA